MKSKSMILMVVSLGFGLVAAIGISKVMGGSSGPDKPAVKTGPVLVAASQFDHGTLLTEENIKVEDWPLQIIPENAVTDIEDVKNMAITTRLSKGLAILKTDIVNKNEIRNLAIPSGFKVVAIKVAADDTINGLLAPGDIVDVIGVVSVPDKQNPRNRQTIAETFLKRLTVFSVNENMRAGGARELTAAKNNSIVSILVNERQSEQIFKLTQVATIKLVLRGDDAEGVHDEDAIEETENKLEEVLGGVLPTVPDAVVADAGDEHTMRIYHGGQGKTFKFNGDQPVDSKQQSVPVVPSEVSNLNDSVEFDRSNENESGFE